MSGERPPEPRPLSHAKNQAKQTGSRKAEKNTRAGLPSVAKRNLCRLLKRSPRTSNGRVGTDVRRNWCLKITSR